MSSCPNPQRHVVFGVVFVSPFLTYTHPHCPLSAFGDTVTITVTSTSDKPLYVRVPSWAAHATAAVNSAPAAPVANGTMAAFHVSAGTSIRVQLDLNPAVRLESWSGTSVSVFRGPLLFSAQVQPSFTVYGVHPFQSRDNQLLPQSEWRWALELADPAHPAIFFHVSSRDVPAAPFNHTAQAVVLTSKARVVAAWGFDKSSAATPPDSPACGTVAACSDTQPLLLVSYGSTDLWVSALPLANHTVVGGQFPTGW